MKLKLQQWLYSVLSTFIGGGAGAVTSSLAAMGIAPDRFNLDTDLANTLKMFFSAFLINGVISVFFLLKKSPLPEPENKQDIE